MSMDAFAASISKGATLRQPRFREALRTGAIFGVVEAATPLIGWGLGLVASRYIAAWDHWIAFTLLGVLGTRMIFEGMKRNTGIPQRTRRHPFGLLIITAIRSEEHTSEHQSLMRTSYAVFCLKKKKTCIQQKP